MKSYDEVYADDGYYWGTDPNLLCRNVIEIIGPRSTTGMKVIDLGCGEGKDAIHFAKHGMVPTAVDISRAGLDKAERWAAKEGVFIHTVQADLGRYRLSEMFDVVYSSGSLTYIPPHLREEEFENYRQQTNPGGLNAFNAFVVKPFIETPPDWGEDEYFYRSGDLLLLYWDWEILSFAEVIFDCDSSGVPHQHAMDVMTARKPMV